MLHLFQFYIVISVFFGITSGWYLLRKDEDAVCSRNARQRFVGLMKCLSSLNEEAQRLRSPLIKRATRLSVFIDVVYDAPPITYDVCCESHTKGGRAVDLNPLRSDIRTNALDTRLIPMIEFQKANGLGTGQLLYSLLLVKSSYDDQYLGAPHKPFILWMVTNIPRDKVASGDVIVPYMGPACVEDNTRYMFLLYKQPGPINVDFTTYSDPSACPEMKSNAFRCQFDARRFALYHKLSMVGANWFDCGYSTYSIYKMIHDLDIAEVDACMMDESANITVQDGKMICPNTVEAGHMTMLGKAVNDVLRSRSHNQTDDSAIENGSWSALDFFRNLFFPTPESNDTLPEINNGEQNYITGADLYEPEPEPLTDNDVTDTETVSPFFKYDTPGASYNINNESIDMISDLNKTQPTGQIVADGGLENNLPYNIAPPKGEIIADGGYENNPPVYLAPPSEQLTPEGEFENDVAKDLAPPMGQILDGDGLENNMATNIAPNRGDIYAQGSFENDYPTNVASPTGKIIAEGGFGNDIVPPRGNIIAEGGYRYNPPVGQINGESWLDNSMANDLTPPRGDKIVQGGYENNVPSLRPENNVPSLRPGKGLDTYYPGGRLSDYYNIQPAGVPDGRVVASGGVSDSKMKGDDGRGINDQAWYDQSYTPEKPPRADIIRTGGFEDGLPAGLLDLNPHPFNEKTPEVNLQSSIDDFINKNLPQGETVSTGTVVDDLPGGVLDLNPPAGIQTHIDDDIDAIHPVSNIIATGGVEDGLTQGRYGEKFPSTDITDELPGGVLDLNPPAGLQTYIDNDINALQPVGNIIATGGVEDGLSQGSYGAKLPSIDVSQIAKDENIPSFQNLPQASVLQDSLLPAGETIASGGLVIPPVMPSYEAGNPTSIVEDRGPDIPDIQPFAIDPVPLEAEPYAIPNIPPQPYDIPNIPDRPSSRPEFLHENRVHDEQHIDHLKHIFDQLFGSDTSLDESINEKLNRMKRSIVSPTMGEIHVFKSSPKQNRINDFLDAVDSPFDNDDQEYMSPTLSQNTEFPLSNMLSSILDQDIPSQPRSIFDLIQPSREMIDPPVSNMHPVFGPLLQQLRNRRISDIMQEPQQNGQRKGRLMIRLFGPRASLLDELNADFFNPMEEQPFIGESRPPIFTPPEFSDPIPREEEIPVPPQLPPQPQMGSPQSLISFISQKSPGHPFIKLFGRIPLETPSSFSSYAYPPQNAVEETEINNDINNDDDDDDYDDVIRSDTINPFHTAGSNEASSIHSIITDLQRNDGDLISKAMPSMVDNSNEMTDRDYGNDGTLRFMNNGERPSLHKMLNKLHNMEQKQKLYSQ